MQATHWPAAVSARTRARLSAAPRRATVLAAFPDALYLRLDGHAEVLPVVTQRGLRLPTALVVAPDLPWVGWGVQPADTVVVGTGEVRLPGATVRAVRTWHPWRCPAAGLGCRVAYPDLGALPWRTAATALADALLHGAPVAGQVAALVGAGPGLTPSGDDVLCGVLIGLRLTGHPAQVRNLWDELAPRLRSTTSLSAALLTEAAEGYAVPQVGRLVDALVEGDGEDARLAASQLRAVGHTSGSDLLGGLVGALDASQAAGCRVDTRNRSAQ